uniref:Putative cytochrome c oxidase subunit II PS17 (Fragments) n=1 Tax=Pinus strobus TaxID=3348 RepID=PS17_PINST|nr:RecName: Full=Putative cytochrome c oxidase subunit II PS17 [Pinus strobus]
SPTVIALRVVEALSPR